MALNELPHGWLFHVSAVSFMVLFSYISNNITGHNADVRKYANDMLLIGIVTFDKLNDKYVLLTDDMPLRL
jgi:hypothetical protein